MNYITVFTHFLSDCCCFSQCLFFPGPLFELIIITRPWSLFSSTFKSSNFCILNQKWRVEIKKMTTSTNLFAPANLQKDSRSFRFGRGASSSDSSLLLQSRRRPLEPRRELWSPRLRRWSLEPFFSSNFHALSWPFFFLFLGAEIPTD